MTNLHIAKRDLKCIWHPCTQMKDHEFLPMIPIKKGYGIYLEDFDGNRYIDAISSWWVNMFGHTNKRVGDAIKEQVDTLEHVIFAGFTHEPIVRLSERLVSLTPKTLTRCFYADNGSSAVEVALKMAYHYYKNISDERKLFVSLTNSYHGETIGALSVGDVKLYKDTYAPILINSLQSPVPIDQSTEAAIDAALKLEECFKDRGDDVCALIIEPLIQAAGSMHMYNPLFLKLCRELCSKYGILLIADEVMSGFGRTGTMFACESADISPDMMVLSKGLTGGYLPLSVTLTTQKIYDAFYCNYSEQKAFLHSHSYTGNAIACAAANATLDIFEQDDIINKNRAKSSLIGEKMRRFEEFDCVRNIRQQGMVAAFDLVGFSDDRRVGLEVYQYALKHEVLLRPLGNTIYFMPPYIISDDEIEKMMSVAYSAICELI